MSVVADFTSEIKAKRQRQELERDADTPLELSIDFISGVRARKPSELLKWNRANPSHRTTKKAFFLTFQKSSCIYNDYT